MERRVKGFSNLSPGRFVTVRCLYIPALCAESSAGMRVNMREITFEVELTAKDLYWFSMRHSYHSFSGIFGLVLSLFCLGYLAVQYQMLSSMGRGVLLVLGLLFTVVQPFLLWSKAKAQVRQNKNINSCLHYTLSQTGIAVSQGEQNVVIPWSEVRKKVVWKNNIYVYLSPVRAFIFPADQCKEQSEEILRMITCGMEGAAKGAESAVPEEATDRQGLDDPAAQEFEREDNITIDGGSETGGQR